jgi:sugar phosphate permease
MNSKFELIKNEKTKKKIGGFLMSLLGGTTASRFGWQATFLLPGIWTSLAAFVAFFGIRNSPSELIIQIQSLPGDSITGFKTPTKSYTTNNIPATPSVAAQAQSSQPAMEPDNLTFSQIFNEHLLKNFRLWLLCFASLFHDTARTGWADWGFLILVNQKGLDVFVAGRFHFCLFCLK